jgi:hypothetical protein
MESEYSECGEEERYEKPRTDYWQRRLWHREAVAILARDTVEREGTLPSTLPSAKSKSSSMRPSSSESVTRITKRKRRLAQVSERFSKLPVAIVLASLWVLGVTLIGLGVLVLYLLGLSLQRVSGR